MKRRERRHKKRYKERPAFPGEQVVVCLECGEDIERNTDAPTNPQQPVGPVLVCFCNQFEESDKKVPPGWFRPSGWRDDTLFSDLEHWRVTGEKRRTPGRRIPAPSPDDPTMEKLKADAREYRRLEAQIDKLAERLARDGAALVEAGEDINKVKALLPGYAAHVLSERVGKPRRAKRLRS